MMVIGGRPIGENRCLVIAELGSNHGGSVETAEKMITAAKTAGADAVKLQCRDNRNLYTKAAFDRPYASENAFGSTYGRHREALELNREELEHLKWFADSSSIILFATAFDEASVDLCCDLGFPAIKIASGSLTDTPLIEYAAATGLPLIISTGGGDWTDIMRATGAAEDTEFALLQCTASYPCAYDELDLGVIPRLANYAAAVGLSMHTNGIAMAPVAYALGARIIEIHMTLDRTSRGTDHAFSLEPQGLAKMVRDLRRVEVALGATKRIHESEVAPIRKMSRSVVAARPLPAGHVLTPEDLVLKAPGGGLAPYRFDAVLGTVLPCDLEADDLIPLNILADQKVDA